MLSREDRILSEILVTRGLVARETVEACARSCKSSVTAASFLHLIMNSGESDPDALAKAAEEAKELDRALAPPLPETRRLGEFRIIREIGRGGMGIVYEAEQEPLGRRVALKILPAAAALDERQALRFLREARAAARLNHPGIVPIHASGHADGVLYFAMELIEGPTLATELLRGPFPGAVAARIGAEVARALAHSHAAGLVHRDIKPENVLLGVDGHARIADFGLVHDAIAGSLALSHHVLGTPAYMAPEQALGRPTDLRVDIYGVGALLYTMLSGKPPYSGEVPSAVLAELLRGPPPPVKDRAPGVPPALARICDRAMSRDPAQRHASAAALAAELEGSSWDTALDPPAPYLTRRGYRWAAISGSAALVAVAAIVTWRVLGQHDSAWQPPPDYDPGLNFRLVTRASAPVVSPSISPDGERIAYTLRGEHDDVLLQRVDGTESIGVARTMTACGGSAHWGVFSHDGRRLAVRCAAGLSVLDLSRNTLTMLDNPTHAAMYDADWSADGREVLTISASSDPGQVSSSSLQAVDVGTGRTRRLGGMIAASPRCSPRNRRIAFASSTGGRQDLWTIARDGGDPVRLTDDDAIDWSPVWAADGSSVFFASDRGGCIRLWRIPVDETSGKRLGEPATVSATAFPVPFYLAISADGHRFALASVAEAGMAHGFPFDAARGLLDGTPIARFRGMAGSIHPSSDGRSLVWNTIGSEAHIAIGGVDPGSEPQFLTTGPSHDLLPRWSPDGTRIAFQSDRSGTTQIWTIGQDGTGLSQWTSDPDSDSRMPVWSPDGRSLAVSRSGVGGVLLHFDAEKAHANEERLPSLQEGGAPFEPGDFSPDGATLAGTSDGIVLYEFGDRRYRRLTRFGRNPVWLKDGARLLFTSEDRLHLLDVRSGKSSIVYASPPAHLGAFISLSADDRTIYATLSASDQELWVADLPR